MKHFIPVCSILFMCVTVLVAGPQARQQKSGRAAEQTAKIRRTIVAWLECEECTEGQLDAVVDLGTRTIPTLRAVLAKGPSAVRRGELQQHLRETYRKMQEHAKKNPGVKLPMSEREYISTYMDNYSALHQSRAAKALGKIGGRNAEQALQTASSDARLRGDVKKVVRDALNEARRKQRQPQRPRRRR